MFSYIQSQKKLTKRQRRRRRRRNLNPTPSLFQPTPMKERKGKQTLREFDDTRIEPIITLGLCNQIVYRLILHKDSGYCR